MDLTPYYGREADVRHFTPPAGRWRRSATTSMRSTSSGVTSTSSSKHRNEPRGVGGVFFDDLNEGGKVAKIPSSAAFR